MLSGIYDLSFSKEELSKISRLRTLDDNRKAIAWIVGIGLFVLTFLSQTFFHGVDWVHALATYGCIPIGVGSGLFLYNYIDTYVETQFKEKWDPLYYKRNNSSPEKEAAKSEIQRITDKPEFYSMPKEQQVKIMKEINEKYGL